MESSVAWATKYTAPSVVGIASPATSSGRPAAIREPKTRTRMMAAIGSETVSARTRSCSDWWAESRVRGP
jgi:hypothetical protein